MKDGEIRKPKWSISETPAERDRRLKMAYSQDEPEVFKQAEKMLSVPVSKSEIDITRDEPKPTNGKAGGGEKTRSKKKQQGEPIRFNDPEPYSEPVNGAALFDQTYEIIGKYIRCGIMEKIAIVLFILHSHLFDASEHSPILGITSPVKRCGKTTLLSLLKVLCPRAISTSNISAPALYRIIPAAKPTVLIDEADSFAKDKEELRGIINSGYSRSDAHVLRCDGDNFEVRQFDVYCPKAIAMIGTLRDLGDTVQDRAIEVKLQRAGIAERPDKFRRKQRESLRVLHSKLARYAKDNIGALKKIEPNVPAELNDRAADGWEPLLAIAELIGETIPENARDAARALSGYEETNSINLELLQDIRTVFNGTGRESITTGDLLEHLNKLEEAPWSGYHRGKELSGRGLAKLLRPFGITSELMRINGTPGRGYEVRQFEDAWKRYLPPCVSVTSVTNNDKPNKNNALDSKNYLLQGGIF